MNPHHLGNGYDEELLYDHFIQCRKVETPDELLDRFYTLFVDGSEYVEAEPLAALHRIATSCDGGDRYPYVVNRCSRILVHYWWFQPASRWAISELVPMLQAAPLRGTPHSAVRQVRQLTREFLKTSEYQALLRLAQVVEQGQPGDRPLPSTIQTRRYTQQRFSTPPNQAKSLRSFVHRYPYLYPHCLIEQSHGSDTELLAICHLQAERQQTYERDLSRYVMQFVQEPSRGQRLGLSVPNPTLLSDHQLRFAIKHFKEPVEAGRTYEELARQFTAFSLQPQSYRRFKQGLHSYLIASIETAKPGYGQHAFSDWLQAQLVDIYPQSDMQPASGFLVARTCQQLVEALIANPKAGSQQMRNHFMTVDLVNNVGATVVTGLLLKLMLVYNKLKSSVERQMAGLYKHYELLTDGIEWLVESLENLQLAFSLHFGTVKLPLISRL
jgi:hypothetical protein